MLEKNKKERQTMQEIQLERSYISDDETSIFTGELNYIDCICII